MRYTLIPLFIVSVTAYPLAIFLWIALGIVGALVRWHWNKIGYSQ